MSSAPAARPSRLLSGTVSMGSWSMASLALGVFINILIARRFPIDAFGIFVLLLVLVSFLSQISNLGLILSIAKFIAGTDDPIRKQQLIGSALFLRLLATAVVSLLALAGKPVLVNVFHASAASELLGYVPMLFFLESMRSLMKSILQGFFRFGNIGISDFLTNAANLAILAAAVSVKTVGVADLVWARAAAVFLGAVFAFACIPLPKTGFAANRVVLRELLTFGFPLQLNDILFFFFNRADTLAIGIFMSPAVVALYEVARKIPDSLRQLYEPFRSVYFSFSARLFDSKERKKAAQLLNDSSRFVAFVTILGAAIAVLFGREIILLVYSEKYLLSVPVFVLLMVNLSASLIGNILGTSLVTIGESDKPVMVNIFNAAASLAGCMILTPLAGLSGAATGNLIGTLTAFPLLMRFLRRKLEVRASPFLKPLAVFALWAACMLIFPPLGLIDKFAALAFFLAASLLGSAIGWKDLAFITQDFARRGPQPEIGSMERSNE